ncbi:DUF3078 domain-containing protein [Marinilabiliaceae bacterium ANBcel2]|nr:DUF3078 domain-containing protein [Marinilabiliaceae bacterium ANBcel2]
MKIRLLVVFLLIFTAHSLIKAQRAVDIYFPEYVIPETWFEFFDDNRFHDELFQSVRSSAIPTYIGDLHIPFYRTSFLSKPSFIESRISSAMIKKSMDSVLYNEYRLNYSLIRPRDYIPYALPLIYKPKDLKPLTVPGSITQMSSVEEYKKMWQSPGRIDTMMISMVETLSVDRVRRQIYYNSPSLVEYHWDDLPDAPDVFRSSHTLDRGTSRQALSLQFRDGREIRRPERLEKVEVKEPNWKFSGTEHIQFSQGYLKNWVRGGQNSISLLSDLRLRARYRDDNSNWENEVIHKLGVISSDDRPSRINDDLFELSSRYGLNASEKWFYSLLFTFRTQFFEGFASDDIEKENPISAFMSPGYFSLAAGMDYNTDNFRLLLSPVTSRLTAVIDTAKIDQTRYNIEEDKKSHFFTGGSFQKNFDWQIAEDIDLKSAMNVFYDYFADEDNIQAEWDLILEMKINVFLSTRIVANFRYYESESQKLQFRETLSLAFNYRF